MTEWGRAKARARYASGGIIKKFLPGPPSFMRPDGKSMSASEWHLDADRRGFFTGRRPEFGGEKYNLNNGVGRPITEKEWETDRNRFFRDQKRRPPVSEDE